MKKKILALSAAVFMLAGAASAAASGAIPDHRGTPMDGISVGTEELSGAVKQYGELFREAGEQYGVDPNLLASVCMQESSGRNLSYREDGSSYPAWGIMQIEYTHEKSFADFGEKTEGARWTLEDRLDPEKAVPYAAWLISRSLYQYDCDYLKMLQAYNFGNIVLDRIIDAAGDDWLEERANAAKYADNWQYETYGDAQYIEHVLRYYHSDIAYAGVKVRVNGDLVEFDEQAALIENERTLVPVRAVTQTLGAAVAWDGESREVSLKKDDMEISLTIDSDTAFVNGEAEALDEPARIKNGRTLVPLRFIAEAFGVRTLWDGETRTVELYI